MGSLMDIRKMCAKMVYTKIALVFTSCKSIQGTGTNDYQMNTYTLYSIPMASHAKFTNMWPKEGDLKTGDGSVSFVGWQNHPRVLSGCICMSNAPRWEAPAGGFLREGVYNALL